MCFPNGFYGPNLVTDSRHQSHLKSSPIPANFARYFIGLHDVLSAPLAAASTPQFDPVETRRYAELMPLEFLVSALVTLTVVVDPLGLVPSFIAVTHGLPERCAAQRRAARLPDRGGDPRRLSACSATGCCARWRSRCPHSASPAGCCCSPSPRKWCSGCASSGNRSEAEDALEEHVRNIAAFPLAIPLMAGPGAITATRAARRPRRRRSHTSRRAARRHRRGADRCVLPFSWRPRASPGCSAPPAISCCRACSACCSPHSRCNSSSTACARRSALGARCSPSARLPHHQRENRDHARNAGQPSMNQTPEQAMIARRQRAPSRAAAAARSRMRIWIHTTGSQHRPTKRRAPATPRSRIEQRIADHRGHAPSRSAAAPRPRSR